MSKNTENRRVNIWINGDQAGKTLKELTGESRRLKNEIKHLAPGTDEYKRKLKELKSTEGVLQKHRNDVRGMNSAWGKVKQEVKAFGVAALAILGGQQLLMGIDNLIQRNAKLDDSFADVMKTTGMTKKAVKDLYRDLGSIYTRTARTELLELAKEAGKLGITGHKNIMDFVEAADKINVALGEDLGEGAIISLGKLNQQFKVTEAEGYKDGLLKTGSAINELGAKSSANEGYLVEFTKRMAGASAQARISIADTLGYASALDNLGLNAEMASTALSQTIIDMYTDASTYAQIAGKSTEEFTQILNEDANAAFQLFLTGLQGNNEGMSVMAQKFEELGIGGARQVSVLASLAGNMELLTEQQRIANQAFAEGTSLTNEFGLKNESLMAKVERLGRAIKAWFINSSLTDWLSTGLDLIDEWIKVPLEDKLRDEQKELNTLVTQIQLANTDQKRRNELIGELQSKYPDFLGNIDAESASNEELASRLKDVNDQYIQRIVLARKEEELKEQQEEVADAVEREVELRQRLAEHVNNLNQQLSREGQQTFTPADGEDYLDFVKRMNKAIAEGPMSQSVNELRVKMYDTAGRLIGRANEDLTEQQKIMQELQGEYDMMAAEMKKMFDIQEKAQQQQTTGVIPNLKLKISALEEERAKLNESSQAYKDLTSQIEHWQATLDGMTGGAESGGESGAGSVVQQTAEDAEKLKKEAEEAAKKLEELQAKIKELANEAFLAAKDANERELLETAAKYDKLLKEAKGHDEEYQQVLDLRNAAVAAKEQAIRERIIEEEKKKAAALLELEHRTQLALAEIRRLEAGTPEEELDALVNQLETERDIKLENEELLQEERKAIILEYEGKINEARAQFADAEKQRQEESLNAVIGAVKNVSSAIDQQYQGRINNIEGEKQAALAALERRHNAGTLSNKEYYAQKEKLEQQFASKENNIRRKQAEARKAFAIFEATLSASKAILAALTIPPPAGALLAISIGAKTAMEIASMKNAEVPKYAKGGFTSFAQGGWVSSPSMAIAGEAGPEWIAPNWMLRNPATANIIGALEGMRSGQMPQYAEGGFTQPPQVTQHYTTTTTNDPELRMLLRQMNAKLDNLKYVQAVVSDRVIRDLMDRAEFIQKVKETGEL